MSATQKSCDTRCPPIGVNAGAADGDRADRAEFQGAANRGHRRDSERCGIVRVTVPRAGDLTVEVTPTDQSAGQPNLEICCVSGNEIYGNPLTLAVGRDSESTVYIGLRRGSAEAESFVVKTSLRTN